MAATPPPMPLRTTFARFPENTPLIVVHPARGVGANAAPDIYISRRGGTTKNPANARQYRNKKAAEADASRFWATFAGGMVCAQGA